MESYVNTTLNEGQQNAVIVIEKFLAAKFDSLDRPYITISGPGGSGKTYLMEYALRNFRGVKKGATISHFAKKVLQDSVGNTFSVFTLAKMLGARTSINSKGELEVKYERKIAELATFTADLIVIDEASMIDDNLFDLLVNLGKKIIAIGDRYQLPPVEQSHDSKFFTHIDAELTQIMRFKGPLYKFSQLFINEIKEGNKDQRMDKNILSRYTSRVSELNEKGSGYVFLNSLIPTLKFAAQEFMRDPESFTACRIVAYKNETIDAINIFIRKVLYGKDNLQYVINELIISDGGYGNHIKNGDIFRVIKIRPQKRADNLYAYDLTLIDSKGSIFTTQTLNRDILKNVEAYEYNIQTLTNKARATRNWDSLKKFEASFAVFKYSYAVSVHKVQGSSISNVYVFEGEIMGVKPISLKEKFQSLYVAVTRATHRTYIYNPAHKVNNTAININEKRFKDECT